MLGKLNYDKIRVYYLSTDNNLREHCYSANKGWYAGGLNASNFVVAPYSKVACCFLAVADLQLRIYGQGSDNTIQEYGYVRSTTDWHISSSNICLRILKMGGGR
jgi:hypothetical protein